MIIPTLLITVQILAAGVSGPLPDLFPRPELAPEDVVRIQLTALAENDSPYPNAGIEITFRFASPTNKEVTGPLPRFIELVRNPVYSPMIDSRKIEFGESQKLEGRAIVPVYLIGEDGSRAGYVFVLGRHDIEDCERCWMTEAVHRVPIDGSVTGAALRPGTELGI